MRCKICDWELGTEPSLYNSGLSLPPVYLRNLRTDDNGYVICDCFSDQSGVDYLIGDEDEIEGDSDGQ